MNIEMKSFQSKEEWLEARKNKIGGSDASCIVGLNPYKTNLELFQEKTGKRELPDISDRPAVKYGIDAEPLLRELFKLDFPEYQLEFVENNMWLNDKYPFAHASLDGWLTDQQGRLGIWECKTSFINSSLSWEKWKNRIPNNYYCQLLHYFMVTDAEFAILKAQLKYKDADGKIQASTRHYYIEREDVAQDILTLANAEKEFAECLEKNECPDLILPEI